MCQTCWQHLNSIVLFLLWYVSDVLAASHFHCFVPPMICVRSVGSISFPLFCPSYDMCQTRWQRLISIVLFLLWYVSDVLAASHFHCFVPPMICVRRVGSISFPLFCSSYDMCQTCWQHLISIVLFLLWYVSDVLAASHFHCFVPPDVLAASHFHCFVPPMICVRRVMCQTRWQHLISIVLFLLWYVSDALAASHFHCFVPPMICVRRIGSISFPLFCSSYDMCQTCWQHLISIVLSLLWYVSDALAASHFHCFVPPMICVRRVGSISFPLFCSSNDMCQTCWQHLISIVLFLLWYVSDVLAASHFHCFVPPMICVRRVGSISFPLFCSSYDMCQTRWQHLISIVLFLLWYVSDALVASHFHCFVPPMICVRRVGSISFPLFCSSYDMCQTCWQHLISIVLFLLWYVSDALVASHSHCFVPPMICVRRVGSISFPLFCSSYDMCQTRW